MQTARHTDQVFVCYRANNLGCPLSKQCSSHLLVDATLLAYKGLSQHIYGRVVVSSARSVNTLWVVLKGVPCAEAIGISPCNFTRFFQVNAGQELAGSCHYMCSKPLRYKQFRQIPCNLAEMQRLRFAYGRYGHVPTNILLGQYCPYQYLSELVRIIFRVKS